MAAGFFEERTEQSKIKAEIVQKYFFAWVNVLKNTVLRYGSNVAYIDLFAGPGRYKDGSASVPVLVLKSAVEDVQDHMEALFGSERFSELQTQCKGIRETPQHTYQMLTKRSERMKEVASSLAWPDNLWMGVSVENAKVLHRIDDLRHVPAAVRFLSLEPLLGPLDHLNLDDIDWVIAGGESGPGARPVRGEWIRSIRDQCVASGTAFHFKQWGGVNKKRTGREIDGRTWDEFPLH